MLRPPPNRQSGNRVVYHPARLYLMAMQHYHLFETRLGLCGIAWSDDGITRFRLPDPDLAAAEKALGARGTPQEPPPHIATAVEEAKHYFGGARIDFSRIGLDLAGVDPFRRSIYDALRAVAWARP